MLLGMLESRRSAGEDVAFSTLEEALEDLRAGRCVIVADDREPGSEGDLLVAAQKCTPDIVNFMVTEGSGIVFLCLPVERIEALGLRPMAPHGDSRSWKYAMTVSIEARHGVTTGISAHDRARTIQAAIDPAALPRDLVQPGHVFPLTARSGGVLERAGRTEAHVDLARLAGFAPAGVAVEVVTDDGSAAKVHDMAEFAHRHGIRIITVGDVVRHRWRTERVLQRREEVRIGTPSGEFDAVTFVEPAGAARHVALVHGNLNGGSEISLTVHAECFPGHVFSSAGCECATRLGRGLRTLGDSAHGVLVYVRVPSGAELACGATASEHLTAVTCQILAELEISWARIRSADDVTSGLLSDAP